MQYAHRIELSTCGSPNCGVHLVMYDEYDRPFAQAILPDDTARGAIKSMQDYLYEKATLKD